MYPVLKNFVERAIGGLEGNVFQEFVVEMMLAVHGSGGFQPMRPTRDRGCDGIVLTEKCVLACFGPQKYVRLPFEKKAKGDWNLYQTHWAAHYPGWRMVVNHEIAPEQEKLIRSLRKENEIWGVKQLVAELDNSVKWAKRRKLMLSLGIPNEQISFDVVYELIEDLIETDPEKGREPLDYEAAYLLDKIEHNYPAEEVNDVVLEYQSTIDSRQMIGSTLAENNDWIAPFKFRVIKDYQRLGGSFSQRINALFEHYQNMYAPGGDDMINLHIQGAIHYVFEQCFIGQEPPKKVLQ